MSRASVLKASLPSPLTGAGLWDRLRDISLLAESEHGTWPVSDSEGILRADVQRFAEKVFTAPQIVWNGDGGSIEVSGGLNHRFITSEDDSTRFVVARRPLAGEITAVIDTGRGPVGILHTNCFVSQFLHDSL